MYGPAIPGMVKRYTLWYVPHIRADCSLVLRNIQRAVGVSPLWYLCEAELAPVVSVVRPTKGYGVLSHCCVVPEYLWNVPQGIVFRKAGLRTILFQLSRLVL